MYIFVLCNKLLSTNSGGKTRYYAKFYKKKRKLKIAQPTTTESKKQTETNKAYRRKEQITISEGSRAHTHILCLVGKGWFSG